VSNSSHHSEEGLSHQRQILEPEDWRSNTNPYKQLVISSVDASAIVVDSLLGKPMYFSIIVKSSLYLLFQSRVQLLPPLKRINVGMPPQYAAAVDGLSSTFTFTTAASFEYCSAIASTVGASIRQGSAQGAKNRPAPAIPGPSCLKDRRLLL
jgi:hypothetical protein